MSTTTSTQQKEHQEHQEHEDEVVYEMFIPCVQRRYKMDKETRKPMKTAEGEHIYDKEATERQIFWVFKQLDWGYISRVQVFGFDDKSKKNATARISYTHMNRASGELIASLNEGATADVNHPTGVWHVVKYTRREPKEPQVTFKIKVKTSATAAKPRPHTPPTEFKPIVKPSSNKFKVLGTLAGATSESESEEAQ